MSTEFYNSAAALDTPFPDERLQPKPVKKRGTTAKPDARFDAYQRGKTADGWSADEGNEDEDAAPLRTILIKDATKTVITRNDSPDIMFSQSINAYRGCEHGCIYCFARPSHAYLGYSAGLDFETNIVVKENAPQLLRKELAKRGYVCDPIALSTQENVEAMKQRMKAPMLGFIPYQSENDEVESEETVDIPSLLLLPY